MNTQLSLILLVEDNIHDVVFIMRAIHGLSDKHACSLRVVDNGDQACRLLHTANNLDSTYQADLILLDMALPKRDGRQVLTEIKANEILKDTPVVIVTGSEADPVIFKTYALRAPNYVHKSTNLKEFTQAIQQIVDFWLTSAASTGQANIPPPVVRT